MATSDLNLAPERATPTPTPAYVAARAAVSHVRPTAPLPQAAAEALARLESAFDPVVAEQRRIERLVSGMRNGESMVINGTVVTAVSLAVAEAVTVYQVAAARAAKLSTLALLGRMSDLDADSLAHAEELMAGARATLAAAGQLDLIGAS